LDRWINLKEWTDNGGEGRKNLKKDATDIPYVNENISGR
jgi:hypothetical protein